MIGGEENGGRFNKLSESYDTVFVSQCALIKTIESSCVFSTKCSRLNIKGVVLSGLTLVVAVNSFDFLQFLAIYYARRHLL